MRCGGYRILWKDAVDVGDAEPLTYAMGGYRMLSMDAILRCVSVLHSESCANVYSGAFHDILRISIVRCVSPSFAPTSHDVLHVSILRCVWQSFAASGNPSLRLAILHCVWPAFAAIAMTSYASPTSAAIRHLVLTTSTLVLSVTSYASPSFVLRVVLTSTVVLPMTSYASTYFATA